MAEKDNFQNARLSNTAARGRPVTNVGNEINSRGVSKDSAVRSKAKAPTRAYAIRAREDASSPDVITGIFYLYDTNVVALTDLGSTYSYICMNLLTLHDVIMNYRQKVIELNCENNETLRVETDKSSELPIVISLMSAQRYVRKGCETFLMYVLNTKVSELKIKSVPVVCEYSDMFPEELPRLPLVREVESAIDLVPGTAPILIAPYRAAPT
ncbi:uncharacterized protein [Gossypium hirsutum]|uniref:Uncharacterized protein n=1 Tax=Gossypium hirsutum TaxID=3635 RepID=A0A1U8P8T8_GOSHI|nr:uncharacterized protein LOC107956378 [Gossypium hirsutum]